MKLLKSLFQKKSQSLLEYSVIILLVMAGLILMRPYVIRSVNAHFKSWERGVSDSLKDKMEPGQLPTAPVCSDGKCEDFKGETYDNCCQDCGWCGDTKCCDVTGEKDPANANYCPGDCPVTAVCGNGSCELGEELSGPTPCCIDCHGSDSTNCPGGYRDTYCCDAAHGGTETAINCPDDCGTCGNHVCDDGTGGNPDHGENIDTCCQDCHGPNYGTLYCPGGYEDGKCCAASGEDGSTCVADCCRVGLPLLDADFYAGPNDRGAGFGDGTFSEIGRRTFTVPCPIAQIKFDILLNWTCVIGANFAFQIDSGSTYYTGMISNGTPPPPPTYRWQGNISQSLAIGNHTIVVWVRRSTYTCTTRTYRANPTHLEKIN